MPVDELEPEMPSNSADRRLDQSAIINYLKQGGLVSILQSNTSGGKNQPRVWLCRDTLGNVTHTFIPERGLIGGETVPFAALLAIERIFEPNVAEVITFLHSFGLNRFEAEDVIHS